jgi:hypothetical protein
MLLLTSELLGSQLSSKPRWHLLVRRPGCANPSTGKIPYSVSVGIYRAAASQKFVTMCKDRPSTASAKKRTARHRPLAHTPAQVPGLTPVRPYPIEVRDSRIWTARSKRWPARIRIFSSSTRCRERGHWRRACWRSQAHNA